MVDALRAAEKFTSIDGVTSYTFPVDEMEHVSSQAFRETLADVLGADYAFDFLGRLAWTKAPGEEAVRFMIWANSAAAANTEWDLLAATLRKIGLGQLFVVDAAVVRRWCYAKLRAAPSRVVRFDQFFNMPSEALFLRLSDWFAEGLTTGSQALSATPTAFTITNPGNARVRALTLRLRSNGVTGFTNPSISNTTTGQSIATTRDAVSALSELRIRPERGEVQFSNDDGASYSNDYALVTLGNTQDGLFELDPGVNNITYTDGGTPDSILEWSFYAAYE